MAEKDDEFYDVVVCNQSEIQDGQVKEVKLDNDGGGGAACLLIKQKGILSALSNKCSHFGASLVKGSLGDGRIRCPFHGACFNITTGDIEDFPGLDSLQKYEVIVEEETGNVRVRVKKSLVGKLRVRQPCAVTSDKVVVIVGGGAAAQMCAETLRTRPDDPWTGRIVMLSEENDRPYDRTKLSKALTSTGEALAVRKPEFYDESRIELVKGSRVVKVDTTINSVETGSGDVYNYDHLVLATGGKPRRLKGVKGDDDDQIGNVFTLRTPNDANEIAVKSKGRNVVVIGASFIGMEVAAYLAGKSASVTVVGRSETPFAAVLGPRIGNYIKGLHEAKGVKFVMQAEPVEYLADSGNLTHVLLRDGRRLEADVCVLGVGVTPNTNYVTPASGLNLNPQGHLVVDDCMRTSVDNVYAAGDVANFPLVLPTSTTSTAIGHWQLALSHGKTAGLNVGRRRRDAVPLKTVPFFWSVQFGKSIRYAGHAPDGFDDVLYTGDVEGGKFAAFYLKDGAVVAASSLMSDPIVSDFANLLYDGKVLTKEDLATEDWRNEYSLGMR